MKHLLDVSTVMALLWERHEQHEPVTRWFESVQHAALCPITELGWLRIATSPAFNLTMVDARKVLTQARASMDWLPCDLPALDGEAAPGSKQTTDIYLANLAVKHAMVWATLDASSKHPAARVIASEHPPGQ